MASISSIGIGSGLDSSLIEKLMAAERGPAQNRLDKVTETTKAQVSAFGALKSALSGLESAIKKFDGSGAVSGRKAVVPDGAGYTASSSQQAVPGDYEIVIEQLATTQKLQSAPLPRDGENSPQAGHGTLYIQVGGGDAVRIEIAADKRSLNDIRDALNAAGSGQFSASIVKGDAGDVLSITSQKTGTAGALTITNEGGDGGLAQLTTSGGLQTHTAAQDAIIRIDGVTSTRSSNQINDVLDGVTLNLEKAAPDKATTLKVQPDNSTLKASMLGFISAWNVAMTQLRTQSAAGGQGKVGGPLAGDAAPRGMTSALRNTLAQAYGELSKMGIKSSVDGSLTLDGDKFDQALKADANAVDKILGNEGSIGNSLRDSLKSWVGGNGMLESRSKSLDDRMKSIQQQKANLDARMERIEANYRRQFIALDELMSRMNKTSSFIQQQFFNTKSSS